MNAVPLALYAIACVRYAMQFASRTLNTSRAASTWLIMAAFSHTFIIGMETMRVGHIPFAGATSAISTFVWLLALSYLYIEFTTGERLVVQESMDEVLRRAVAYQQAKFCIPPQMPSPSSPKARRS